MGKCMDTMMGGKNNLRYKALVDTYNALSSDYQDSLELMIPTLYTKDVSSTYFKINKTS